MSLSLKIPPPINTYRIVLLSKRNTDVNFENILRQTGAAKQISKLYELNESPINGMLNSVSLNSTTDVNALHSPDFLIGSIYSPQKVADL